MSETPKLTPEERAEAAILYERLSGDGDALERFICYAVSIRAKLERELAAERERAALAEARAYSRGLQLGWNLGVSNDNDGFNRALSDARAEVQAIDAARRK